MGRLQPGDVVLHYELEARLGAGGMGTVWRARDRRLDRPVALKFLADTVTADKRGRERLVREARLASRLKHPNVCTVYALEEVDDTFFIVMELVEGRSLAAELEAGPLSVERALAIADQLLDGLAAAHAQGLIHRDIKPANLLIEVDGTVKIADFGLAWSTDSSRLSSTGMAMGTLAYASPEQVDGKEIDARTDLYSSGVVLYQMLTAELPIRAEHPSAWVRLIVSEPPPPVGTKRTEVPAPVQEAVAKALAKEPAERFDSAAAMRTALGGGASPRLQPAARPRRSRRALVLGAALLVAAGAGGAAWYTAGDRGRGDGTAAAAAPDEPGPGEPQTAAALALYREAQSLLRNEDWTGAQARLEQVLAHEPDAALAHALLALAVRDLGLFPKAQAAARQARLLAGDLPRDRKLVVLIVDAFANGKGTEMIAAARELIALRPDDLEAGILMLWAQAEAKELAGARELFDRLRRLPPPAGVDPRLDRLEAMIEVDPERRAAVSTRCRQRALRAGRKLAAIDCLMGQGEALPDDAMVAHADLVIAEARAAGYPAPVVEAHRFAADALQKAGNHEEAARRYRAAIAAADELLPNRDVSLRIGLAHALNSAGRPAEALAVADEALRACGDRPFPGCPYHGERARAHALGRSGDLDGARAAVGRAIADARSRGHFEDLFGAVEHLAQYDIDRGDWRGAEDGYQRYLDWARQNRNREAEAFALFQFGRLHADQDHVDQARRERTQAVAMAEELKTLESKTQNWRSGLAYVILQQGDLPAAEAEARRALELGPKDNNFARAVLVRALARQGKLREARLEYELLPQEVGGDSSAGGDLALASGDRALAERVVVAARRALAAAPAEERRRDRYNTRLDLARAELVLGEPGARARRVALRKEAQAGGFLLYARHARELLSRR